MLLEQATYGLMDTIAGTAIVTFGRLAAGIVRRIPEHTGLRIAGCIAVVVTSWSKVTGDNASQFNAASPDFQPVV
jgi:hypothetical protein